MLFHLITLELTRCDNKDKNSGCNGAANAFLTLIPVDRVQVFWPCLKNKEMFTPIFQKTNLNSETPFDIRSCPIPKPFKGTKIIQAIDLLIQPKGLKVPIP